MTAVDRARLLTYAPLSVLLRLRLDEGEMERLLARLEGMRPGQLRRWRQNAAKRHEKGG